MKLAELEKMPLSEALPILEECEDLGEFLSKMKIEDVDIADVATIFEKKLDNYAHQISVSDDTPLLARELSVLQQIKSDPTVGDYLLIRALSAYITATAEKQCKEVIAQIEESIATDTDDGALTVRIPAGFVTRILSELGKRTTPPAPPAWVPDDYKLPSLPDLPPLPRPPLPTPDEHDEPNEEDTGTEDGENLMERIRNTLMMDREDEE